MTGLDPEKDVVLEIATIITDSQLNILEIGPCMTIHQPDSVLDNMDPWCVEQHGKSGLTKKSRESTVTVEEAENATLDFIKRFVFEKKSPLCGNTIGQDRRFMVKYMSRLHDYLHYRSIDVSTLKELVLRWYPNDKHFPEKSQQHEALEDIRESIRELAHYRKKVFK